MENLAIYDRMRQVPQEAIKTIRGGKLNGFSDINPMWRIKRMTEVFGAYGTGWRMEIVDRWKEEMQTSSGTEVSANVMVAVSYRTETNEWSEPAYGFGGNKLCGKGKGGDLDDEAWKMALTDAIGVAMKLLGMAADIYFEKDVRMKDNMTKYSEYTDAPAPAPRARRAAPAPAQNQAPPAAPKEVDEELYRKMVKCAAEGLKTRKGEDCREYFRRYTGADDEKMKKFDADVDAYRQAELEKVNVGEIQQDEAI